jgi:cytochrome c553
MSSDQQPQKWGYGLTWLVIVGLIVLIAVGVTKLRETAKVSYAAHLDARVEAEKKAIDNLNAETKLVESEIASEAKAAADLAAAATKAADAANAGLAIRGKQLYMGCMACHGDKGQGNPALKSPAVAGQDAWYLEAQIKKFLAGIRGGDIAKDTTGGQMAMMVKQFIKSDEDVRAVIAYIRTLEPAPIQHSLSGNAETGKTLYATCMACHQPTGVGNPMLKAPSLVVLPDWYIVEQLKKFKTSVRGAHPLDNEGKLMLPMSQMLADETAMINIAEYIKTLKK